MRTLSVLLLAGVLAACASGGQATTPPSTEQPAPSDAVSSEPPAASASEDAGLTLVALGDSWVEGAHCGGCRTFGWLYARRLETVAGQPVEYVDRSGDRGGDSTVLLGSLREDDVVRNAVADADVVLIATGPNEMMTIEDPLADGTCGGDDDSDCIRALGETWTSNFDAAVTEIEELRAGQPTAIRLVNAANIFVSLPELVAELGYEPDFAVTRGALAFELLTQAVCDAAAAHGAQCLDVRPILNGPDLDQPTDENSRASMQAIADALTEIGLPELD